MRASCNRQFNTYTEHSPGFEFAGSVTEQSDTATRAYLLHVLAANQVLRREQKHFLQAQRFARCDEVGDVVSCLEGAARTQQSNALHVSKR